MKIKFLALIAALAVLACNSPKKEKESKTTTVEDSLKVVPKDESVTQKADSSNQSAIAKTEDNVDKSKDVKTDQKTTKKGDNVDMHYRGTLASDGSEFDASYNRGTPLSFQIGAGRVIKG